MAFQGQGFVTPVVAADNVPASWISYAQRVTKVFKDSLAGTDPVAGRFHSFLENAAVSASDRPPPTDLIVKAWIDPQGRVVRVAFDSFGVPQADQDLRELLMRHEIGEPPPSDMLQPLRVRLLLIVMT